MPKARRRTWLPPRQDKALVDDGAPAKDGTDAEAPVRRKCEAEGPTKFPSNLMDVMIEALQAGMMLLGQVPSVAAPAPAESPSVPTGNAGTGVTFETAVWEEEKEPPAPAFRMDFHDVMAGGEWDEAEKEAKKKKPVKGGKGLKWNARLESIHERASLIKPDRDDVTEPPQIGEVGIGGGGEKPGAKVRGRRGSSAEIATRTLESIGRSFNSGKHLHAAKLGAFRRESVVSALDDPTSTYVHGRARAASVIASSPAKSRSASMLGRKMSRRESRKMSRMSRKGSRLFAAISEAGVDAVPLRHRRASGGREKLPAVAAARGGQPDGGGGGAKQRHASAALMADLGALGQLIEDPTDLQTRLRQSALVSAVPQVAALPARLQTEISRACECRWYSARQEVLGYGLPLDALYVIRSGRFSTNAKIIDYGDYVMREYTEGMLLGEHALSETVPSPVGICCVEPGEMYILYGEDYRKIAEGELTTTTTEHAVDSNDASDTLARRTEAFLEKLPCCLPVPSATLASLAAEMEEGMSASLVSLKQTFSDAHNDASLLVLKGGKLTVTLPRPKAEGVKVDVMDARSITFQQGDVLGALAISTIYTCLEVASANERFASGRCTILKVGSAHGHLVPPTMRAEGDRCYTRKVLRATEFAKSMGVDEVDELLDAAGPPVVFPPGALITRQGLAYDEFHVMISGVARAFVNIAGVPMNGDAQSRSDGEGGDTTVGYFGASDHFGGVSILDPDSVRKVSVAAAAGSEVRCLTLTKETLAKVNLLSRLRHLLARDFANRKWTLETKKSAPLMHNLLVGGTIGQGSFGTVKIAQDKQSASTYALKTMKKLQVVATNQVEHVLSERKLLSTSSHPFLLRLVAAYQDDGELHLVTELILGGQLFHLLQDRKYFDVTAARFYVANIASAFAYLGSLNIIYRDLKPENVLIDERGYLKVCDLGFAKIIDEHTFTFCGTPDYMAPEIIRSEAHSTPCDWWSLGIFVYELMIGKAPFAAETVSDVLKNVLEYAKGNTKLSFPWFFNSSAQDLIRKLLVPEPQGRLRPKDVAAHPFLESIDFLSLEKRQIAAPWLPEIISNFDTRHCIIEDSDSDSEDDEEEAVYSELVKQQAQQLGFSSFTFVERQEEGSDEDEAELQRLYAA